MNGQAPHDRPTASELVQAVEDLLRHEVMDAVDGRVRFHVRVAANALAIVIRQMALADDQEAEHGKRLARLGVRDDAELAGAIRSGALDDRYDEVLSAVRAAVSDKLAVANPRYATDEAGPAATPTARGDGGR